jgi:hypothetical protein
MLNLNHNYIWKFYQGLVCVNYANYLYHLLQKKALYNGHPRAYNADCLTRGRVAKLVGGVAQARSPGPDSKFFNTRLPTGVICPHGGYANSA